LDQTPNATVALGTVRFGNNLPLALIAGGIVATLATGRHMQGGAHPVRSVFVWDGREDSGQLAPDGTYFVQVSLIHQGRTVVIAPNSGGPPSPIKVETHPPAPVVSGVIPRLVPRGGSLHVRFRYTGNEGHLGTVRIYRTDLPGGPRLVTSFLTPAGAQSAIWDGLIGGRRAPAGVYLVGLDVTDAACNIGRFPRALPPRPGSTRGAGVTIRYLAAQPPLTPVPAGATAVVYVDSRLRPYRWALRPPGSDRVLVPGTARGAGYFVDPG